MRTRSLENIQKYLSCQLRVAELAEQHHGAHRPFVTISRQAGAGGITIGEKLAASLSVHDSCGCAWGLFDKGLVEKVIEEHKLPERLAPFLKEDKISEIRDILDDLLGLHPPEWSLVKRTSDTVLHLAQTGHAVLVGRGSNVLTRRLEGGFHVRLVAPFEPRLRHIQEYYRLGSVEAARFIQSEDAGREHYLKAFFGRRIDDPLLYDLVINTERVGYDEAAAIIEAAVLRRIPEPKPVSAGR